MMFAEQALRKVGPLVASRKMTQDCIGAKESELSQRSTRSTSAKRNEF